VSPCPDDADTAEILLDLADAAMYAVKRTGRNRFRLARELRRDAGSGPTQAVNFRARPPSRAALRSWARRGPPVGRPSA
jgi:hypothetical protein